MLLVTCRLRSAVGIHLRIESIMASIHPLRRQGLERCAIQLLDRQSSHRQLGP
jgi:hypothetical protein